MVALPRKILLASDFSAPAREAADAAAALALASGAELRLLWCVPLREYSSYAGSLGMRLDEAALRTKLVKRGAVRAEPELERLATLGVSPAMLTRFGSPADEICRTAEEMGADLIVLGSRGAGATRRLLLGSVAERVVRHAGCSVLVVRGEGPA